MIHMSSDEYYWYRYQLRPGFCRGFLFLGAPSGLILGIWFSTVVAC